MGLLGLLIAVLLIILFFIFTNFSFHSPITPQDSKKILNGAQDAMDSTLERSKLEQNQIKNIDLPF